VDAKKLLLEIFDKVLLGLVAALFAAYVALAMLSPSPADKARDTVNQYNRRISELKERATNNAPKAPGSHRLDDVSVALGGGPLPEEVPGWLFHKRPFTEVRVKSETLDEPAHYAPVNPKGTPGLGQIAVSWEESTQNKFVVIESYKVFRAEGEAKDWKEIKTLDGKAHSFLDKGVQTRTNYWYYVESHAKIDADHPYVKKHPETALAAGDDVKKSDQVGPFVTNSDVFVEVINATPKSTIAEISKGDDHPASVQLHVWKHFESLKEWKSSQLTTYTLDPDKPTKVGGPEGFGSSKLDFSTDVVITGVVTRQEKVEGMDASLTVQVVVFKDTKTGDVLEIVAGRPDPNVERFKKNPKDEGEAAPAPE
jgi:hypothetical protein